MGWMPLVCFSKTNSHDPTSRCDIDGKPWSQAMCPHISKKKSKPLTKSSRTKQYCKSSYTIFKGPLDERHGEHVKA
jgi:hypothetical protein